MAEVVVAIPTFRRPQGLTLLLDALRTVKREIRIVVADNDCEASEGVAVVEALKARSYPLALEVIRVPERGIAQVRNALVAHALADPDVAFVAMIDDDEWPHSDWLDALLRTQATTGAHVVGGPVVRSFEVAVPDHVCRANAYGIGARRSGSTDFVDATSNILFDAAVFRSRPGPWFDSFFALTGGEDKDFLLSLKHEGRRFAWSDEARVTETLPASRCSTAWALQRAYSTGNSDMLINLRRRPPGFGVLSETLKIAGALTVALAHLSILSFSSARRFEGRRLAARVAGKLSALFGHRHQEYRVTHGR